MDCLNKIVSVFDGKLEKHHILEMIKDLEELKRNNPRVDEDDLINHLMLEKKKQLLKEKRFLDTHEKVQEIHQNINKVVRDWGKDRGVVKDALYSLISDNGRSPRLSHESHVHALTNEYYNVFQVLEKEGFFKILRDKENAKDFVLELSQGIYELGYDKKPNFSNKLVERAAHIIHGLNKKRLMDLQSAGFEVEGLKGYIFSSFFKPEIVSRVPKRQWIDETIKALDVKKQAERWGFKTTKDGVPLDGAGFYRVFEKMYDEITGHKDISPIFMSESKAKKALQNPDYLNTKVSAHRELIYKDGRSYAHYHDKYSGRNFAMSIRRDIRATAQQVATMRTFGMAPDVVMEHAFNSANDALVNMGEKVLSDAEKKEFRNLLDITLNRSHPHENLATRFTMSAKKFAQVALLSKTSLKAHLLDPTIAALNLSTIGKDNYYSSFAKYLTTYYKSLFSKERRLELAKHFDVLSTFMMEEMHQESMGGTGIERGISQLASKSSKYFGVPWQTLSAKTASAYNASVLLHDVLTNPGTDYAKNTIRNLHNYGFSNEDLALLLKAGVTEVNGNKIISGDFLRNSSVDDLRKALDYPQKEITILATSDLRKSVHQKVDLSDKEIIAKARELATKINAYFNDHANRSSPTPTIVNNYKLHAGIQPDTIPGALVHLVMQFKAFAASTYRVHRYAAYSQGIKEENVIKQYMMGGKGAIKHTLFMGTVMGGVSLMIKDILHGKTPRDPTADPIQYVTDSFIESGTGGLVVDMALNDYERGTRDFLTQLGGPIPSMINDAAYIMSDIRESLNPSSKKKTKNLVNTVKFIKRWAPYSNYYGVQAVFNSAMMEDFNTWIDPKYHYNRRKQMRENSGMLWKQQPLFGD